MLPVGWGRRCGTLICPDFEARELTRLDAGEQLSSRLAGLDAHFVEIGAHALVVEPCGAHAPLGLQVLPMSPFLDTLGPQVNRLALRFTVGLRVKYPSGRELGQDPAQWAGWVWRVLRLAC